MQLGICVVYLFDDAKKPLFDLHIEHIRRHTGVPFRIFGAAHKLSDGLLGRIRSEPELEVVDCDVPAHYSVREEHSHCLARLSRHAFDQGCTHVVCLHLDSFPIADGWAEFLAGKLDEGHAFTSLVPNGYSACLFWSRATQESLDPPMLIDREAEPEAELAAFREAHPHLDHVETGVGFLYAAWQRKLDWFALDTDEARKIYGGLIFHMVGSIFRTWIDVQPIRKDFPYRQIWSVAGPIVRRLPEKARHQVRRRFVNLDRDTRDGSANVKEQETRALMRDPDAYIGELRRRYDGPLLA